MSVRVKIEGLKELQANLQELGKATGRNVMRRVLMDRAEPIAEEAAALAPVRTGDVRDAITASSRLGRKARRGHGRLSQFAVEVYVGPTEGLFYSTLLEFGTITAAPKPFMRPAWDAAEGTLLDGIRDDIWAEIEKAVARKGRKAAKMASGGE